MSFSATEPPLDSPEFDVSQLRLVTHSARADIHINPLNTLYFPIAGRSWVFLVVLSLLFFVLPSYFTFNSKFFFDVNDGSHETHPSFPCFGCPPYFHACPAPFPSSIGRLSVRFPAIFSIAVEVDTDLFGI